jgi:hypothetical protein|tara:strand:+ start:508 stop:630 length:123 start_codon:yes stop_codon:yes gene_type:complete
MSPDFDGIDDSRNFDPANSDRGVADRRGEEIDTERLSTHW